MKILVNTPSLLEIGGVANHYKGLRKYWTHPVSYNFVGTRNGVPGFIFLPFDIIKFFYKILFGDFTHVMLNPSLSKKALHRDAIYLTIAKMFSLKVVVFFHGWDEVEADKISSSPGWFLKKYSRADSFIVLANKFREKMICWGITSPIKLSTTKVDNNLLRNSSANVRNQVVNLLFLARVEKNKGIYITLDAFSLLKAKFPNLKLIVAGSGTELPPAKEYAILKEIENVIFLGNISGEKLSDTFSNSDIYILPTTHGEGMPTSILEAMAFGMPIITRPIGGIVDFFDSEKGVLIDSTDAVDFAKEIESLCLNPSTVSKISKHNMEYSRARFLASVVALDLEKIISQS